MEEFRRHMDYPFGNQVRERHLYTDNHRRGMYLQITLDGQVSGSDSQTQYSVLELKSVQTGEVVIIGRKSSLFLCVDGRGRLRGQSHYTEADCTFRELLLADGYTRFICSHYGLPVSLAPKHSQDRHVVSFTRFLPLRNTLSEVAATAEGIGRQPYVNLDSHDPFGMETAVVSPQIFIKK
ncbi:fibroblast growth factor 21-like [Boleophthalmus pectinirostris]|uniref:fibroblast growth factor 21-like n=1 Tax=Boleophthalmus pectinirostris TaxID=150288 RepID=UPI00242A633B|nr:fibroblast growth factor 21-like [Boleophthalmus pectinirostris]